MVIDYNPVLEITGRPGAAAESENKKVFINFRKYG
jgi:hypothetical protein